MSDNLIVTEFTFKNGLNRLMEEMEDNVEIDVEDLSSRIDDIDVELGDNLGRVGYIRQLTAELLDYLQTLNKELKSQVEIPQSEDMMSKILSRKARKRYYLSKYRL